MQSLKGPVGDGSATNARHDAALVQAMLNKIKRPANLDPGQSVYVKVIDGDCGNRTKAALRQFQYDYVFVGKDGASSQNVPGVTAGQVLPNDPTWTKLVASLPSEFSDMRVLKDSKTVYLPGTPDQVNTAIGDVGKLVFKETFRPYIRATIQWLYDTTGLVASVCGTNSPPPSGARRDFQTQYDLLVQVDKQGNRTWVTHSGPGESNHNFGQAVDLGLAGLRWLAADGTITAEKASDWWLHKLDPPQRCGGESAFFWAALRRAGEDKGLFRGPVDDHPHLQAWSDAGIDMATRLADLLTRTGKMRWAGRNQRYQCDLGFGGVMFEVGTAAQIWTRLATVTKETLTRARAQARGPFAAQPVGVNRPAHGPSAGGSVTTASTPAIAAATDNDVKAMRDALRDDFDAADAKWTEWRAT